MKKILFLLLLLPLLGGGLLSAQTVSNLQVMPGATGSASTVTFDVSWDEDALPALWSDTMWVFVDYNKNGKMTRLPLLLSAGATLTATSSPGVGELVEENIKGAWVVGDARTNSPFSATVQLFTDETTIAGACAYASSCPPVGKYISETEIVFTGTPMYEITLVHENGYTFETIESGGTFLLPCSYTVSSFTDATGAPGILGCIPSTDIYNLTVSATTYCAGGTVTFALDNTTLGRTYQLYKDGAEVDELTGTGGGATFTGTFAGAGNYAARVKDNGTYCAAQMTGAYTVTVGQPGAVGEDATCGCASGLIGCSGTCRTPHATQVTGNCSGVCHQQTVNYYTVCGAPNGSGTVTNYSCCTGCGTSYLSSCYSNGASTRYDPAGSYSDSQCAAAARARALANCATYYGYYYVYNVDGASSGRYDHCATYYCN
jgi:hypothetical protein